MTLPNLTRGLTLPELRRLFSSADAEAGPHVLWIEMNGDVHLDATPSPTELEKQLGDRLRVRLESYGGLGYVGREASQSEEWMAEVKDVLEHVWAKDARGYYGDDGFTQYGSKLATPGAKRAGVPASDLTISLEAYAWGRFRTNVLDAIEATRKAIDEPRRPGIGDSCGENLGELLDQIEKMTQRARARLEVARGASLYGETIVDAAALAAGLGAPPEPKPRSDDDDIPF